MEQGIRDQPAGGVDRFPRGVLIGAILAVCAVAWWVTLLALSELDSLQWLSVLATAGMFALLAVGYIAGLKAALRRPTRRLGIGILSGLTLIFPASVFLTFLLAFAIWGGR